MQHSQQLDELRDFDSNPVDGRTDDLIMIKGFKLGYDDDSHNHYCNQ